MRNVFILIIFVGLWQASMANGDSLTLVQNNAFTFGEKLTYKVHYGPITAGNVVFEVAKNPVVAKDRQCYHVSGVGKTQGAFNWFFKVRDIYETWLDTEALVPWKFVRDVYEGGYTIYNVYYFNHLEKKLKSLKADHDVPFGIQDVLSAIYRFRAYDYTGMKKGDKIPVTIFIDEEIYLLNITYAGKEVIETGLGRFRCLKFKPQLLAGTVFKEDADMSIWVTDDPNRLPIRIESEILVGAIQADLKSYSGLKHPMTARVKKKKK